MKYGGMPPRLPLVVRHEKRRGVKIEISKEQDAAFAVVDIRHALAAQGHQRGLSLEGPRLQDLHEAASWRLAELDGA